MVKTVETNSPVPKPNLSVVLPTSVLDDVVLSFEAIFGLKECIAILDMDDSLYYGLMHDDGHSTCEEIIRIDGEAVGCVVLYTVSVDAMLRNALHHLGLTLSHIGTEAWRRYLLADEVLARYDELNLIYGLGTSFVQGTPQNEIFENVLSETNRIIRADAGVIYAWNTERSNLSPVSYFGSKSNADFWDGRVRELALSTLYAYEQAQVFDSDKVICAPLRYDEEFLGSLVLVYEREDKNFRANDVNLLTTLTHNTALFIHAARLVDKLAAEKAQLQETLNELQTTRDRLSQAERLSIIGQTVSNLVHDMRKPLNNVMGYAGLLQETDLSYQERVEFADQIMKYIKLFSSMMQEILDYVAGNEKVQKALIGVDEYMALVSDLLMPPGLELPVKIIVNSEAAHGFKINIDTQRFTRVFQNLVNNAIDAIESKGGTQVEIRVEPIEDLIRFTVADDGPGVPPEIVSTLFEPFVTMGKSHGTGLGLAIADRMVSIHGGKIRYEALPTRGAKFIITLPKATNGAP